MSIKISTFKSGVFLSVFVLFASLFLSVGAASAADTVGIIDSQKVLFQHPNFEAVVRQVGTLAREKQAAISADVARIPDVNERLKIMTAGAQEVKDMETRLMEAVDRDCMNAVQAVAKARKITVILEKDAAYYGGRDITEDVIAWMKKNIKTTGK